MNELQKEKHTLLRVLGISLESLIGKSVRLPGSFILNLAEIKKKVLCSYFMRIFFPGADIIFHSTLAMKKFRLPFFETLPGKQIRE